MKRKTELSNYFTDQELIKILCQKRIKEAKKAHDQHFLRNISISADSPQGSKKNKFSHFFLKDPYGYELRNKRENF